MKIKWQYKPIGGSTKGCPTVGYTTHTPTALSRTTSRSLYKLSSDRPSLLDTYYGMLDMPEIAKAIQILAEDIASADVDNSTFGIDYPGSVTDIKSSVHKTLETTLEQWSIDTGLTYDLVDIIKDMLITGLVLLIRNKQWQKDDQPRLLKLDPYKIVGYKAKKGKLPGTHEIVTHYLYQDDINKHDEYTEIPVEDLVVLRYGSGPFGESILRSIYRVYKQFSLLSDAMVIHRIVRAPQRRVFIIDTGNLSGTRAEEALRKAKQQLTTRTRRRDNGDIDSRYDVESITEDYYIAVNSEGRGSRVETLEGDSSGANIEDVELMLRRMARGMMIPEQYLGIGDRGDAQWNDGRLGMAYMDEMRHAARVKLIQTKVCREFTKDYKLYLDEVGINIDQDFDLMMYPPQSFAPYKELELQQVRLNVVNSMQGLEAISIRFMMENMLGMDPEEIKRNEDLKLEELGHDPKKVDGIKRANLVYGEGDYEEDAA